MDNRNQCDMTVEDAFGKTQKCVSQVTNYFISPEHTFMLKFCKQHGDIIYNDNYFREISEAKYLTYQTLR